MSTPRGVPPEQRPVHRITSAPEPLTVDQSRRQRSYLLQMGVRVLCFVGAVLTFHRVPVPVTVVLVIGAVVLPYTAVLVANAGRERQDRDTSFLDPRLIEGTGTAASGTAEPPRPADGPAATADPQQPDDGPATPDVPGQGEAGQGEAGTVPGQAGPVPGAGGTR